MPDNNETSQLRLGVFTTASIVAVADGLGLFAANGISVIVEEVKGSGAQMQGLRDGHFQVVHTSPDNIIKSRLGGDDVFVFFVLDSGLPQLLVGRNGVADWDAVSGGRIGVDDPESGFAFVVYELLRANDVDLGSCKITSVGSSRQRLDALAAGEIDAGLLSAAMSGRINELSLNVLASAAETVPWYPGIAAATSRSVADAHPELLRAYASALQEAMRWVENPANADEARALVAARMALTVEEAQRILEREAGARTSSLPNAAEAAEALLKVADLRAQHTGQRTEGSFDDRWMRMLGTES